MVEVVKGAIDAIFAGLPMVAVVVWTLVKIIAITVPLIVAVAFYTLAERKVIGWMQVRRGPVYVGQLVPGLGVIQAFADVFKMLFKESIVPSSANAFLHRLAPLIALAPAFAAWAVIPFGEGLVIADVDAGLLVLLALTSMGVYGIIIGGWASNSKYAFLGALRSAAQVVSYEIAMGFALVGVLVAAGTMNLTEIVHAQKGDAGLFEWFWLPLLPLFVIYFISGVAETNRAPFDVAEGESEIVAGFHVEYSGSAFAIFFLAEYANMAIMFLGGWLSPFPASWGLLGQGGFGWLFAKIFFVASLFLWFRASFPRYRYDQIMRLGWKVFIPVTLVWILVVCLVMMEPIASLPPFSLWFGK